MRSITVGKRCESNHLFMFFIYYSCEVAKRLIFHLDARSTIQVVSIIFLGFYCCSNNVSLKEMSIQILSIWSFTVGIVHILLLMGFLLIWIQSKFFFKYFIIWGWPETWRMSTSLLSWSEVCWTPPPKRQDYQNAKKPTKATSLSDPSTPGVSLTQGLVNLNRAAKNLRRPRNSLGRGLPKKGGARDKGTWRKLRDEVELPWVDPRDLDCVSDRKEAAEVGPGIGGNKTIKLNALSSTWSRRLYWCGESTCVAVMCRRLQDASRIWKFLTSTTSWCTRPWSWWRKHAGEDRRGNVLQALLRSFVITIEQMWAGFQRVYDQMVDISIDVPQAYSVLERWVLRCRQAGIINDDILKKMPSRGRKRFVSEGDDGLIKDSSYWNDIKWSELKSDYFM